MSNNNLSHCCDCTTEMAEVLCKLKGEEVTIYEKNNAIVVGTIQKVIDCSIVVLTDAIKFPALGALPILIPLDYNKLFISICEISEVGVPPALFGSGDAVATALQSSVQLQQQ